MPSKSHLIVLGTPCETWVHPVLEFAERTNADAQKAFRRWQDDLFGLDTHAPQAWSRLPAGGQPPSSAETRLAIDTEKAVILCDPRACWSAEVLLAQDPQWHILGLYELPAEVLARHGSETDPTEVLATWKEAAQRLLSLVRRHRARLTLLAAGECRAEPDSWTSLLHDRYGLTPAPAWNGATPPLGVPLALGALQASADREVVALLAELEAASEPVSPSGTAPRHDPTDLAGQGWHHLRDQTALLTRHQQLVTSEKDLATRHQQLATAFKELESKHSSLVASSKNTAEENELLLLQLHQVQEELERQFLENSRRKSEDTDLTARHQQLATSEKSLATERDALKAKLANLEKDYKALTARHTPLATALEELQGKHSALVTSTSETKEENELLLLQLHQVQEELEHYFLENRRLERQKLAAGSQGIALLQADGIRLGYAHETGPHRHLNFILENARLGDHPCGEVHLRLVEHHGRAGLAIFQHAAKKDTPLLHWNPSGEENGRSFMLAVPEDEAGRKMLVAAPASDLLLLREGALMLAAYLASEAPSPSTQSKMNWARLARTFPERVDDLPARLHYDDIKTSVEGGRLHFAIRHAWCPGRYLPSLDLTWRGSTLTIQRPERDLPLVGWTVAANGQPAPDAVFDLGAGADPQREKENWSRLTKRDRQLVELVVAELPNFVHHLGEQHPKGKFDADRLRAEASRMRQRAKAYAAGRRPKRFLGLF